MLIKLRQTRNGFANTINENGPVKIKPGGVLMRENGSIQNLKKILSNYTSAEAYLCRFGRRRNLAYMKTPFTNKVCQYKEDPR